MQMKMKMKCSDMEIGQKKQGNSEALIPGSMIHPIGPIQRIYEFVFDGLNSNGPLEPLVESNTDYFGSTYCLGDIDTVVHEALQRNKI